MALIFQCQNVWLKKRTCKKNQLILRRQKMPKNRLIETLKHPQNGNKPDYETVRAISKIENHKRLSSQEFKKVYDIIWKEGPKTTYKDPDNW